MRLKDRYWILYLGILAVMSLPVTAFASAPFIEGFNNITLEMSLKPFKKNDQEYIRDVCRKAFRQWQPLLQHADTVSVMLWTSDGSEILDYSGDMNQELEWAKYIGNPNAPHPVNSGPRSLTLHDRAYTYIEQPPVFTYGDLKFIVRTIREEGVKLTGKPIRVGATFDPGPEFAVSSFKYERHPEVCMANTMGTKSFVVCYATLNADNYPYAAYPEGIPQGTLFGTFLGKQSTAFLGDLGFDYLWLSNGFGFGMETWNTIGAIFDGQVFHGEKMEDIRSKILLFWTSFREGCPDFRVETRGTNLSTGIDLARDGVDLKSIYEGNFNILPPPNSPWAALDGDFGLELTGFMSRMAELPDDRYLFRFYTHDPWWANSPWLDRYGRESHDIYMPMSVSRIDSKGKVKLPTHLNFLSIDDSYGNMPDQVPNEVIPHILQARKNSPDAAGPVVWVYPFDEYHRYAFKESERLEEIFYGDWFIRQAINEGFPVNTVVSTTNLTTLMKQGNKVLDASVLVTIVPDAGSDMEKQLMDFIKKGGKVMLYGPAGHASNEFLDFMNIRLVEALSGTFNLEISVKTDHVQLAGQIRHDARMSGGGVETVLDKPGKDTKVLASVVQDNQRRDVVVLREDPAWNGGSVCYVRGTNSATYTGSMLLSNDDPDEWFIGGSLMRYALSELGYAIFFSKDEAALRNPVNCISRQGNGFYFAGYVPNQTVEQQFRFPQGVPVFTGTETRLKNGFSTYRFPKSWNKECRVFVEQDDGIVACREMAPVEFNVSRKIGITGLNNATVRVYPENDGKYYKAMPQNNHYPAEEIILESKKGNDFEGNYYEYKNITGELVITW
ncbi:hypothetical protein [uncultured Proteiniphilum sp.]|uniref:hypothetical protein n=1 Tax=uncultured Proteiniphilum sp. TaxID=497637 RepID=UPI002607476A|nr:hypothetical protein [uncultured Proteiniphilum sp.]